MVRASARPDDRFQQHPQLLAVERLLQQRNARVPLLEGMAVSGHESEGNILCEQDVGNLAAVLLLVDSDVHQRAVEVILGDFIERRRQPVRDLGDRVAELRDHVVKHLADEKVILDDEDARRARRIVCHELMPQRCRQDFPAGRAPLFQRHICRIDAAALRRRQPYLHTPGVSASNPAMQSTLAGNKFVVLNDEGGALTPAGKKFLREFGATLTAPGAGRRIFCRPCLDWSERRYHIAGHVGAEICRVCIERGWLARQRGSRALRITAAGRRGFREIFGVQLAAPEVWK